MLYVSPLARRNMCCCSSAGRLFQTGGFRYNCEQILKTFQDNQRQLSDIMNRSKRHFTEEAFLFSTFMEFNKCWRSGKKSRLVIESNVNGFAFAFINFSAFLGYPETLHVAPPEKRNPESNVKGNLKRKQTRKPSVITLEQRGFRPRNDRRTMRLHQKHLRMILSPQRPLQGHQAHLRQPLQKRLQKT